MRPPKMLKPYVNSFCREVVRSDDFDLSYVPTRPLNVPANDCFVYVAEHAEQHGGKMILGWAIWERPKVFIEAEFHAVWQNTKGELVDLNPRPIPVPRVLFLREPKRSYHGRQVDNFRKPLSKDPKVKLFLNNQKKWFGLLNEGELADFHGEITLTPQMKKIHKEQLILEHYFDNKFGPWSPEAT